MDPVSSVPDKLIFAVSLDLSCFRFQGSRTSQVVLGAKTPPANAGNMRDVGSVLGWRTFLGGGRVNPLQYSCLGNLKGRGAW